MENGELSKKLDEGSLSEGVVDGGVEGEGRSELGEVLDPSSLNEREERGERKSVQRTKKRVTRREKPKRNKKRKTKKKKRGERREREKV